MQNSILATIASLATFVGIALSAEAIRESDMNEQLDRLAMSFEFGPEEQMELAKLPPESVALLTQRLNALEVDQRMEARFSGFLKLKIEQFSAGLPSEMIDAAVAAMERKLDDPRMHFREVRRAEFEAFKERLRKTSANSKASPYQQPKALGTTTSANPRNALEAPPSGEASNQHVTLIWAAMIGAAFVLLWLVIKPRTKKV